MNTSYQRTKGSDEWYTPRWLTTALGHFDLDPCAAPYEEWQFADTNYTKEDDGLRREWFGRVFCNPPYSKPLLKSFVQRMVEHNNGILLLFSRFDTEMFQDLILPNASSMLLLRKRLRFSDSTQNSGCGSVLFEFGGGVFARLRYSRLLHKTKGLITMNHQEEIIKASREYSKKLPISELSYEDIEWAYQEGAETERDKILEEVDSYVKRMVKDIPTPFYDYEEGLRVAFLSVQEWLHNKFD